MMAIGYSTIRGVIATAGDIKNILRQDYYADEWKLTSESINKSPCITVDYPKYLIASTTIKGNYSNKTPSIDKLDELIRKVMTSRYN